MMHESHPSLQHCERQCLDHEVCLAAMAERQRKVRRHEYQARHLSVIVDTDCCVHVPTEKVTHAQTVVVLMRVEVVGETN